MFKLPVLPIPHTVLRKRANAGVNDSGEHCTNSYQRNIALQKSDQKKRNRRNSTGNPVNQRLGNQIQRYNRDYAYNRSTDAGEKRLKHAIFTKFFNILDAAQNENERRQKHKEGREGGAGNPSREIARERGEQHEWPWCRYT